MIFFKRKPRHKEVTANSWQSHDLDTLYFLSQLFHSAAIGLHLALSGEDGMRKNLKS